MGQPLRVLIVDDSESDAILIIRQLTRDGFAVTYERVDTAASMREALEKVGWDIVISDFVMPAFSGLDALEVLRQKDVDVPFIVVSGKIGEDTAVNAMRAGADDYFMKDKIKRLGAAVKRELLEAENRRQRSRAEQALRDSEATLAQAQEIAHLGNWNLDVKTGRIHWSDELYRIHGLDPKQVTVATLDSALETVHKDDRELVRRSIEEAERNQKAYDLEYRIVRHDKSERFVQCRARVILDKKGKLQELVGTVLDITERKQAEQALLAYQETLRSLASEVSLAEERERRRIAVGIHDVLSQSLASCIMQAQALQKRMAAGEENQALGELGETLRGLAKETRSMTFDLSSPILYDLGLEAALRQLVKEMGEKQKIAAIYEDDGRPKIVDMDVRVLLFQTVRELLINVTKHAKATTMKVLSRRTDGSLQISVEDDGAGFDPAKVSPDIKRGGFGLFSIRERMHHIGGQLEIDSEPGHGARVVISVPLKE